MNTFETINCRKSVRSYTGEPPTKEQLGQIIAAAQAAPVGRAQYGTVRFTVVSNPALLAKIDAAGAKFFGNPDLHPLYGAPVLVVVSVEKPEGPMVNVACSNAAIVAHNMALAATELGVGVCHIWGATIAASTDPEIVRELGVPEGFVPSCAVCLGQTAETYAPRAIPADRMAVNYVE